MKCLHFACLCLLWVPPTNVCADVVNGIDILSSVYSIDAPWSFTWSTNGFMGQNATAYVGSGNYGGSSSDGSPLGGHLTSAGPYPPGLPSPGVSGWAAIDRFVFENHNSAWPNGAHYGSDGGEYGLLAGVHLDAQARWTFRPTGDSLQIALHISDWAIYGGYSGLSVNFSDITHPSVLLAFSESDAWRRSIQITNVFAVSTSDSYELTVHGWADTFDTDYADQSVYASIQIVPEPRAFDLCLLGLLSLAWFKRWPTWGATPITACSSA